MLGACLSDNIAARCLASFDAGRAIFPIPSLLAERRTRRHARHIWLAGTGRGSTSGSPPLANLHGDGHVGHVDLPNPQKSAKPDPVCPAGSHHRDASMKRRTAPDPWEGPF